jgi:SAM-dependent methyltransferase
VDATPTTPGPLVADDDAAVRDLRAALWAAGYTLPRLKEVLGFGNDSVVVPPGDVPGIDRQLPRGEPLPTLIRLFLLAVPVPVAEVAAALGTLSPERCADLGAITLAGEHAQATCRLVPARDVLVAVSREHEFSAELDADHVMGITPSTDLLADLTLRRPVGDVLDVCCGGGLQALLCARHARRVVATDLNPRAVNFAAFNARLNGLDNVELRQGDLFEPVGDEEFDLIVANPPFIISPDSSYAFRDSGLEGDEISKQIVRGAAERLRDGGHAFVLVGWAHGREQDWDEPLRPWVEDLGCDAWLLRHSSADPLEYAVGFNRSLAPVDPEGYSEAIDRWLDYDQKLGIEAIGYGAVILRRREGKTWVRADTLHQGLLAPAGEQVARVFESQDLLVSLPDREAVFDLILSTNPKHRLEQVLRPSGDGYAVDVAGVVLEEGMSFRAAVDVHAMQILVRLDGKRTLREVLDESRREVEPGMSEEEFAAASLRAVRRMIELGFVLPVT